MDRERAERLRTIAVEIDSIVAHIGPKWIRLTHLRNEAKSIIDELKAQGEKINEEH